MGDIGAGVLSGWTSALCRFLTVSGVDVSELLRRCEIDPVLLEEPINRIPAASEAMLWHEATRKLPMTPHYGLLVPAYIFQNSFYSLSLAMASCENLAEALKCMGRCMDLISEVVSLELIETKNGSFLRYKLPDGFRALVADAEVDATFATLSLTIKQAVWTRTHGNKPLFKRLYLTKKAPMNQQIYADYYQAEVVFGAEFDQVEIDTEVLQVKNPAANCELAVINEKLAKEYITQNTVDPIVKKVLDLLTDYFKKGIKPKQDQLASDLHMSLRQLQRKLTEAGVTYTDVLSRIRHILACEALRLTTDPVSKIALDLGFSDQSNFTKSFRKWENLPPLDYRKQFGNGAE